VPGIKCFFSADWEITYQKRLKKLGSMSLISPKSPIVLPYGRWLKKQWYREYKFCMRTMLKAHYDTSILSSGAPEFPVKSRWRLFTKWTRILVGEMFTATTQETVLKWIVAVTSDGKGYYLWGRKLRRWHQTEMAKTNQAVINSYLGETTPT